MDTLKFSVREDLIVGEHVRVRELMRFLHQLDVLYNRLYVLHNVPIYAGSDISKMLRDSFSLVPDEDRLSVNRVVIHSPGEIIVIGVGVVIYYLPSFIERIFDAVGAYHNSRAAKENREAAKENREAAKENREHQRKRHQKEQRILDIEVENKLTTLVIKQLGLEEKVAELKEKGFSEEQIDAAIEGKIILSAFKLIHTMHKNQIELD